MSSPDSEMPRPLYARPLQTLGFRGLRSTLLFALLLLGCHAGDQQEPSSGHRDDDQTNKVTLFAFDELTESYEFQSKKHGVRIVDGKLFNICSALVFNRVVPNHLTLPGQGGTEGAIETLGDLREPKYGASVFHSIVRKGDEFCWHPHGYPDLDPKVLRLPTATTTPHSVPCELGSIYIMKYRLLRSAAEQGIPWTLVKARVVDYAPGRFVTLRWKILHERS